MKMMSEESKLCSLHGLAGPSLALREGDHTIGGVGGGGGLLTRRHGTRYELDACVCGGWLPEVHTVAHIVPPRIMWLTSPNSNLYQMSVRLSGCLLYSADLRRRNAASSMRSHEG